MTTNKNTTPGKAHKASDSLGSVPAMPITFVEQLALQMIRKQGGDLGLLASAVLKLVERIEHNTPDEQNQYYDRLKFHDSRTSDPRPTDSPSDQVDAVDELLYKALTSVMPELNQVVYDNAFLEAKAKVNALLLEARIDELKLLDKVTKKHVYVERDGYLNYRIAELTGNKTGQTVKYTGQRGSISGTQDFPTPGQLAGSATPTALSNKADNLSAGANE